MVAPTSDHSTVTWDVTACTATLKSAGLTHVVRYSGLTPERLSPDGQWEAISFWTVHVVGGIQYTFMPPDAGVNLPLADQTAGNTLTVSPLSRVEETLHQ